MFVYSEMHAWQNEPAVQQVLVFSSEAMKDEFEKTYSIATQKHDPKLVAVVSENNMGAIYKLRAILRGDGLYDPVIRCGFTGGHLGEYYPTTTASEAIQVCKVTLAHLIANSLE